MSKWSENSLAWCLIPFGVSASLVGTAMYRRSMKQQREDAQQAARASGQPGNRNAYRPM